MVEFSTGRQATPSIFTAAGTDWACGVIAAFIVGHVCQLAIREDIMSDDTVISTMINGIAAHSQTARQALMNAQRGQLVMKLGNLLWADEGIRYPGRPGICMPIITGLKR